MAADSSGSSSTCHCEGFCYCGLGERHGEDARELGEESYRSSTVISWQRFPPSTSSRSRCDDSSMEMQSGPSLPESSCKPESSAEVVEATEVSSTEYPIVKSNSQLAAEHYLSIRHVFEFFNFLIGHLICAEPDDPVQYLRDILDRCITCRDCYGEEPLLVTRFHIKSLYDSFDPFGNGSITAEQYELAMDNIGIAKGITPHTRNPPLNAEGRVSREFFLNEAHRCLRENLDQMLRIPKDWEENRRSWKRAMHKKTKAMAKKESWSFCQAVEDVAVPEPGEEESETPTTCRCGWFKDVVAPGTCPCPPRMRLEPEQLFLTGFN